MFAVCHNDTFNVIRLLLIFYRYLDIVYKINAFSFLAQRLVLNVIFHSYDPPCSTVSMRQLSYLCNL